MLGGRTYEFWVEMLVQRSKGGAHSATAGHCELTSGLTFSSGLGGDCCCCSVTKLCLGFPGGSAGKESACNAGDHSSILGSG